MAFGELQAAIEKSIALAESRRSACPEITFPEELPISEKRGEIAGLIRAHQVVIVAGDTGSGKTTQLPKICLELGRGATGLIGHTQPRRIAARTVASRIAEELHCPLGEQVGYQVRFTDHSNDQTLVKLMTDGVLLAEIRRDRFLSRYDTLIIDEAHERSLNIDFLLGYLRQILPRRPDLKIVITSATIDVERFSRYFNDAPVVRVSGRTYPVDIRYLPLVNDAGDTGLLEGVEDAVETILGYPQRGDILVFFSSEREIREASVRLRKRGFRGRGDIEVLPLYGRLSLADQNRVFSPHRGIRVVLATNVAETSLTVPGIRYVVDTGYARVSRYSYRTKVQRLPIEAISQASANQRAGRCGRVAEGVCIRLYSEEDFHNRPEYADPEIVRTNLAAVILQMLNFRIGDVRSFPFIDAPDRRLVNDGFQLLNELGALKDGEKLNDMGRQLSRLPVDPRLGRMLIAAGKEGCLPEVLVIVAALSIQDPRERPAEHRQAADEKHRQWQDSSSDFIAFLNLWNHLEEQRSELSRKAFEKYCKRQFLSPARVREWRELHHQLHQACRELKLEAARLPLRAEPAPATQVHRALLTGLLSRIGYRHEKHEYLGTRNRKFSIFPGSGLFKTAPRWLMAAELIETTRLYAHRCAAIDPAWLPEFTAHLVNKSYSEPHYHAATGRVMAWEKQALYGLVIQERRRVPYGKIDPIISRQIFIQSALVEGTYGRRNKSRHRNKAAFFEHNQKVMAELHELEEKFRRRDIVADERELYTFYDARVGEGVVDLSSFERWRKQIEINKPRILYVDREQLTRHSPSNAEVAQFPAQLEWEGYRYPLIYRFEPGHVADGLSVDVPVAILHQCPGARFDWLVPGMLRDKCIELIKSLPRQLRKTLVPVPDTVDKVLSGLEPDNIPLTVALAEQLHKRCGVQIDASLWQENRLDHFYQMNFRLLDEAGGLLEQGRDLAELRRRYRNRVRDSLEAATDNSDSEKLEIANLTRWSFEDLPELQLVRQGKLEIRAYPALVDLGDRVALQLLDTPAQAARTTRRGLGRLATLELAQVTKYLRKQLFREADLRLAAAGLPDRRTLIDDLIAAAMYRALFANKATPRSRVQYQALLQSGKGDIAILAQQLEAVILSCCDDLKALRTLLLKRAKTHSQAVDDVSQQLDYLFRPHFLRDTGNREGSADWLRQYPRYIKAALARFEKLPAIERKDRDTSEVIAEFLEWWQQRVNCFGERDDLTGELEDFRFMLEEYRVSVYAQQLKTLKPISTKRLKAQQKLIDSKC